MVDKDVLKRIHDKVCNNRGSEDQNSPDESKNEKQSNSSHIRAFKDTEINEIHNYIEQNVKYSALQKLFILDEKPSEKAKVFTSIYALIDSAKGYCSSTETRKKLNSLLRDCAKIYDQLYGLIVEYENSKISFDKRNKLNKIVFIVTDPKSRKKIHDLRSAFLVFVEKQVLVDIDKISAINPESSEGQKIVKELRSSLES